MGQRGRPRHPELLTPREQDVLALIRDGLTNEQIAEHLNISFETAKSHVSLILSKLGVATREEAAAWKPEPERPSFFGRIVLALAGTAVVAGAVAGLALLAWGLSRSGSGDTQSSLGSIVDGPVYYLPPNDNSLRIASDDLLQQANIKIVNSGSDLFSLAPNDLVAVIIDKSRWNEVNPNWLIKEELAGNVIVGARLNMNDLLQTLGASPSGTAWTTFGPERNFFSLYSKCFTQSGSSHGESENPLDAHPDFDFRFMLTLIASHARATSNCPSPPPTATPITGLVQAPNLMFTTFSMADDQNGWIGGTSRACKENGPGCVGVIYHTADGGNSWVEQYSGEVQVTGIAFQSSDRGYAIGPTGKCAAGTCPIAILRTNDGGLHWDEVLPMEAQLVHLVVSADDVWVLDQSCAPPSAACSWGLRTSSDGGDTWTSSTLASGFYTDLSRPTVDDAWLVISPAGSGAWSIISTHDAGRTWNEIPTPAGSAGLESHIFFRNANDGWLLIGSQPAAGSQFKEVFGTTDAGETWTRLAGALFPTAGADTNTGISTAGYVGPIVFTSDVDGWIASPRNGLLRSSDGGTNWSVALQDDNLQALQFTDTDHGWTMSLINFWSTSDGGAAWQSHPLPDTNNP